MIRNICIVGAILGLSLVGLQWLLQGDNLPSFAQHLPGSDTEPMLLYYVGQVYYSARDYDDAGAQFKYVFDHFPTSPYTERARVFWLECRVALLFKSPSQTLAECEAFLQQYPESPYKERIGELEDICRRGMLH